MKLKEVIIHNFKSIAQDCTLNVDKRITSIVGASEAGKTNVLEALNKFYTEKGFDESDICSFNDEGINNDTDMVSVVFELGENDDREEISQIDERLIKAGIFTIRKRMTPEVVTALKKLGSEVQSVDRVTGPYDTIVVIEVDTMDKIDTVIEKIRAVTGVYRTVTCVAI